MTTDVVMLLSGGLDSATLAYHLQADGQRVHALSVDYGQRHRVELAYAIRCAERLGIRHDVVHLPVVGTLLAGSALTMPTVAIPEGHHEAASQQTTIVPNRNAILLSLAAGVALSEGASTVAYAAQGGDHAIYPDCRPAFVEAFNRMLHCSADGAVSVLAPFITMDKAAIVRRGAALRVPFAETWSCYRGELVQCGRCGACTERRAAFEQAEIADLTSYAEASR